MPTPILMPALSPTMTQGHLVKWHKQEGDRVRSGDLLMDIETDKATMEVEATQEGVLDCIVIPAPTESVSIGQVIAVLRSESEKPGVGEAWRTTPPPTPPAAFTDSVQGSSASPEVSAPDQNVNLSGVLEKKKEGGGTQRMPISPLARKIAALHGMDVSTLEGSGPRGRIIKQDVERALAQLAEHKRASSAHQQNDLESAVTVLPLTPMRKVIAQRLSLSKQTIPHFYLSVDCQMDELLHVRTQMNRVEKVFSVNDFMVRACALALAQCPHVRTLWDDTQLVRHENVDLAVAVSIDGGLITPIVRHADTKPLSVMARELRSLVDRARKGQLKPQEYQGGTFTLSNLGMLGVDHFQPIINPPHSGILAIGCTRSQPIVKEGAITIAQIVTVTIAADHRVVDGEAAARFLQVFKGMVENPYLLLS
jgi:pyruvate dehydrogenase E2 component (dihydrolipoamide acetyltransferase)